MKRTACSKKKIARIPANMQGRFSFLGDDPLVSMTSLAAINPRHLPINTTGRMPLVNELLSILVALSK